MEEKFAAQKENKSVECLENLGRGISFFAIIAALVFGLLQAERLRPVHAPETEIYAVPVSARQRESGIFGNISIRSQDGVSLEQAFLIINGETCGDFATGELTVRVYPEDVLCIDASAYQRELRFSIQEASPSISRDLLAEEICCHGDQQEFGMVEFK